MKIRLLLAACIFSVGASAQDMIIKKNGDEIQAKVLTVSDSQVNYKKWSNQDGPTYILPCTDIFMIKYTNGDKDVFGYDSQTEKEEASSARYIKKTPAVNSMELINKYNQEVRITTQSSNKNAKWFFTIFNLSDSSVLATEDIEVSIVPMIVRYMPSFYTLRYYIEIKNKTDATIYIDKANTFKIYDDGSYETYFDTKQVNVTQSGSTGVGINLGGVANVLGIDGAVGTLAGATTVGGASQNAVTKSYTQERILAIPPYATANLSEFKQVQVKGQQYELISDAESFSPYHISDIKRGAIKKGEYIRYDETNSPYLIKYHITYSTHADFSVYSTIAFSMYIKYLIGENIYSSLSTKESIINSIQKYVPDFWDNPYIIIGNSDYIWKQ